MNEVLESLVTNPKRFTQEERVYLCLTWMGEVTSRELREIGIKKPSNVIIRLKKRHKIITVHEEDVNGFRVARYILAKPPVLKIKRGETRFWKRR